MLARLLAIRPPRYAVVPAGSVRFYRGPHWTLDEAMQWAGEREGDYIIRICGTAPDEVLFVWRNGRWAAEL